MAVLYNKKNPVHVAKYEEAVQSKWWGDKQVLELPDRAVWGIKMVSPVLPYDRLS